MSRAKVSQETVDAARAALLEVLHDGDTVYTVLRSVSRSGMSRRIDLIAFEIVPTTRPIVEVQPRFLSYSASIVLDGKKLDRDKQGIRVDGGGMDMGFHLVDQLSKVLSLKLIQRWL